MEPDTGQNISTHNTTNKTEALVDEKDSKLTTVDHKKQTLATNDQKSEVKYFECNTCILKEKYEYFGKSVPWVKDYKLEEDAYLIEDPFLPPKRGEFLILGAHCVKCNKTVCKDPNCSFYFAGTYCMKCAKECRSQFPKAVQDKLNRIVVPC